MEKKIFSYFSFLMRKRKSEKAQGLPDCDEVRGSDNYILECPALTLWLINKTKNRSFCGFIFDSV